MKSLSSLGLVIVVLAALVGCGDNGSDKSGDGNGGATGANRPRNRVNWGAVSSEYNPSTDDFEFRTDGYEKINVDAFGFRDDAEVVYSKDIPQGHGYVRLFKVFKGAASWGYLSPRANGSTLEITNYGSYQCSIRITNGRITALDGGCYVRMQVFLPVDAQLEVYNVNQLISKRFYATSTEIFLEQIDDASFASDKFVVIENYLASYRAVGRKPAMTAAQLGKVIDEFMRGEEQLKALRKLHFAVTDRENLAKMIEDEISYFDREEARKIVGIK